MIGIKYCLSADKTSLFAEIVKSSYDVDQVEMCNRMGFVPIVVDELVGEEVVIRVPSSRVQFKLAVEVVAEMERIGGEEMTSIQAELWRVRRSLELLKSSKGRSVEVSVAPRREEALPKQVMPPREEQDLPRQEEIVEVVMPQREEQVDVEVEEEKRSVVRTIDRIKVVDAKVRKIKEYVSGAVICDDGRERWINAEWTQTCEYVLTPE